MFSKAKWIILALPIAACVPEGEVWSTDQGKRQELFQQCMSMAKTAGQHTYSGGDDDQGIGDLVRACNDVSYYQSRYCVSGCSGDTGKPWAKQ